MKPSLKSRLRTASLWCWHKRRQLLTDYRARRESYHRRRGVESAARGTWPAVESPHTFAFIPRISWHDSLYGDLRELGPLSEYDYAAHGYTWEEFWSRTPAAARRRREMNDAALAALRAAHARRRVDWLFMYASGLEVRREFLEQVRQEFGIPIVALCLDDKQSWDGPLFDGQRIGQIDIAGHCDRNWTSARVAYGWYQSEGGKPLYLPEGFDAAIHRPMSVSQDIPVSFIGGAYGFRPAVIDHLRKNGIPIRVFGQGWPESEFAKDPVEIFNRSLVNLGMGGIGYAADLSNVKGRDFEIPGTGGGVYLTSFNSDLAQHFHIGREILCYANLDELVEMIRWCLDNADECRMIAARARERCLREHRWLHRYQAVLRDLGILGSQA